MKHRRGTAITELIAWMPLICLLAALPIPLDALLKKRMQITQTHYSQALGTPHAISQPHDCRRQSSRDMGMLRWGQHEVRSGVTCGGGGTGFMRRTHLHSEFHYLEPAQNQIAELRAALVAAGGIGPVQLLMLEAATLPIP